MSNLHEGKNTVMNITSFISQVKNCDKATQENINKMKTLC